MNQYPENWPEISFATKVRAKFTCQRCWEVSDPWNAIPLHTHHIDFDKGNSDPSNLRVLCIPCHHRTHLEGDPLWYPQPEFENLDINKLRKPVRVGEVIKDILSKYLKIQRVFLSEVKP